MIYLIHVLSWTRPIAGDSSLFYAAAHIAVTADIMNHDMQLLTNWARQWFVTLNTPKPWRILSFQFMYS